MEERRMQAADLFEQGVTPAEIARRLSVWHQIVSDWHNVWRRCGRDGLRGAGRAGRRPKITREQLEAVEAELAKGAEAHGYPNDVWTLQRVAEVIERTTGVQYHPARVWHILRHELGWSWERPARRATERNDEARTNRGVFAAFGASDVSATRADARPAPSLQLETAVAGRRPHV
jgi:transposase